MSNKEAKRINVTKRKQQQGQMVLQITLTLRLTTILG